MSNFLAGAKGAIAAGAVVLIVGGIAYYQFARPLADTPELQQISATDAQKAPPKAAPAAEIATNTTPDVATPTPPPTPRPPEAFTFDEVRQDPDGTTIIAGRAVPGAQVRILQGGNELAQATADGLGKFAAIGFVAPNGQGRVLSLVQSVDGVETTSPDQIVLAPLATQSADVDTPAQTQADPATSVPELVSSAPAPAKSTQTAASATKGEAVAPEIAAADPASNSNTDTDTAAERADNSDADDPAATASAQPEAPRTEAETADAPQPEAEPQQVAVLKTTEQGVELLNVPQPASLDNVALDTISYSDAGDVQLAGRAQPDTQSVRVYLDNTSVVILPVDDQGRWRGDLPGVDEGVYTLRVDEVSQAGAVTSRVETPFKREAPEVLAEAAAAVEGPLKQITVQRGATLWGIAEDRYGNGLLFVNVFRANAETIRDPDLIYPGQIFNLPDDDG